MYDDNLVILRGTITREPLSRDLPSGSTVIQLELTTRSDDLTASVPVAVHDRPVDCAAGDEVVVIGHVNRRFFRAGGVTQSRTEVIAHDVVRTRRRRTVERLLEQARDVLVADRG